MLTKQELQKKPVYVAFVITVELLLISAQRKRVVIFNLPGNIYIYYIHTYVTKLQVTRLLWKQQSYSSSSKIPELEPAGGNLYCLNFNFVVNDNTSTHNYVSVSIIDIGRKNFLPISMVSIDDKETLYFFVSIIF